MANVYVFDEAIRAILGRTKGNPVAIASGIH
jgi:hypothetical protein